MMILLHGANSLASRQRLLELKAVEIDSSDPSPQENSLFSQNIVYAIWHDKKMSATQIKELQKKFPDLTIEEFKINPVVFKFLDNLRPGNQSVFMPFWQEFLKQDPPEVAFVMIVRQFRLMLDPRELQPWQIGKIAAQAKLFKSISEIYKKLLEIDYHIKTGQSVVDLRTALELLLLSL